MKKLLQTSLFMMAFLSLEQAHAKQDKKADTTQEAASKESWAYKNRYKIAGGAAALGVGAAGYLYQNEIAGFIKSLTPQQAAQEVAALESSIASDLKDVTKQEAMVDAKEHKSEESVADMQADIATKQDKIAKEQNMLEWIYNYWNSEERAKEINPENKPVDSWGFYKSTPNSQLTPEEEAAWAQDRASEKAQDAKDQIKYGELDSKTATDLKKRRPNATSSEIESVQQNARNRYDRQHQGPLQKEISNAVGMVKSKINDAQYRAYDYLSGEKANRDEREDLFKAVKDIKWNGESPEFKNNREAENAMRRKIYGSSGFNSRDREIDYDNQMKRNEESRAERENPTVEEPTQRGWIQQGIADAYGSVTGALNS